MLAQHTGAKMTDQERALAFSLTKTAAKISAVQVMDLFDKTDGNTKLMATSAAMTLASIASLANISLHQCMELVMTTYKISDHIVEQFKK